MLNTVSIICELLKKLMCLETSLCSDLLNQWVYFAGGFPSKLHYLGIIYQDNHILAISISRLFLFQHTLRAKVKNKPISNSHAQNWLGRRGQGEGGWWRNLHFQNNSTSLPLFHYLVLITMLEHNLFSPETHNLPLPLKHHQK